MAPLQLELPFEAPPAPAAEAPPRPARRPRLPSTRRLAALERLARHLLRRLGKRGRWARVAVVWNPRLRTAAGRADGGARTIELNPRLLDRHPEELVPTLVHELCHLAAGIRHGHGEPWKAAMRALGHPPAACHHLDVEGLESRRRRWWRWRCVRCGETYLRRHRGARRFACSDCGGGLRVESEVGAEVVDAEERGETSR